MNKEISNEAFKFIPKNTVLSKNDKQVKDWRLDSNIILLYSKYNTLSALEEDYTRFVSMPMNLRIISDQMSLKIFNKKNKERYELLKSKFYSSEVIQDFKEYDPKMYNIDPIDRVFISRSVLDDKEYLNKLDRKEFLCSLQEEASDFDLNYHIDTIKENIESDHRSNNIFDDYGCQFPMYTPGNIKFLSKDYPNDSSYVSTADFTSKLNKVMIGDLKPYAKKYGKTYLDMIQKFKDNHLKKAQLICGWNPELPIMSDRRQYNVNKRLKHMANSIHIIDVSDYMHSQAITSFSMENEPIEDSCFVLCKLSENKQSIKKIYFATSYENDQIYRIGFTKDYQNAFKIESFKTFGPFDQFIIFEFNLEDNRLKNILEQAYAYSDRIEDVDIDSYNMGAFKIYLFNILKHLNLPIPKILYKVSEGTITDWRSNKDQYIKFKAYLNKKINAINPKLNNVSLEAVMTNEFPVEFNKDGDLLISKGKRINFEGEYSRTHLALKMYEKNKNITGMKYCICKLWYMNIILEEKIHDKKTSPSEIRILNKSRSKILNDINKYSDIILKIDRDFDIIKTYQDSPFNSDKIRLSNYTLNHSYEWIKKLLTFKNYI